MKYFILMCDGAADCRIPALDGKTPLEAAVKPTVNMLSYRSFNGLISYPSADAAPSLSADALAVLGYDAKDMTGIAPLKAASVGVTLAPDDTAYRCSFITVSEKEEAYGDRTVLSVSNADVTEEETTRLISALNKKLSTKIKKFYGVGTEGCLVWKRAPGLTESVCPDKLKGKRIGAFMPAGESAARLVPILEKSFDALNDHPVNVKRREQGKLPLNSIWLWSAGKLPEMENFEAKWNVSAVAVCSDQIVRGAAACAGIRCVDAAPEAAAEAAVTEFSAGADLVFVHTGAAAKAAFEGDAQAKVRALEETDSAILAPVYEYLCGCGDQFKILFTTGAAAETGKRAYAAERSPFFMYNSARAEVGYKPFSEANAAKSGFYLPEGFRFMPFMIRLPAADKEETTEEDGQKQ